MKKLLTGVLTGSFLFIITRTLTYLLGLDVIARQLAQDILRVPTDDLYLVAWLISGLAGLIALVLWLVFNVHERLSNILSPRPVLGSLPIASDPTFKLAINRTTGRNTAELFVDLINKSDKLISTRYELKATINGRHLDQPITGGGLASPDQKTRLFVRIEDVPANEDLLAYLEYGVSYFFSGTRAKARRTAKGIEWKSERGGGLGPKGGKVVKVVTVRHYNEIEQ